MNERRRCQRIQPTGHLRARVHRSDAARVLDLSPHGAFIETTVALRPGSECGVALSLSASGLHLRGSIQRCRATKEPDAGNLVYRAGLEFVGLSQSQLEMLEDLVAKLCLLSGETHSTVPHASEQSRGFAA
ncbi:MAG: PilZ domain-containing protein [Thermoanaerobaculales bacterium]|nr:PilZ domain-containing protein [Thermoanaerobaculales bacterium]